MNDQRQAPPYLPPEPTPQTEQERAAMIAELVRLHEQEYPE